VYAFSASAPTFQIPVARLKAEIGPRLVALVNDLQADILRQTRRL
jgi:hypothetical protein